MREVLLYLGAAVVVAVGCLVLTALIDTEPGPPWVILRKAWARPIPWAAFGLVALLTVMAVVQVVHPAVIDDLQRDPHGGWWRCVTAASRHAAGSGGGSLRGPARGAAVLSGGARFRAEPWQHGGQACRRWSAA